jgi:predicted GNAT family acetyltransferase
MAALTLERFDDASSFLAAAGPFLRAREVEHALMLGIAGTVESGRQYTEEQNWFARVHDGDRTVAAALRTPPHNVLVSAVEDERAIELVARAVLEDSRPPGMFGPSEVGKRLVEIWRDLTGEPARVAVAQRLFVITSVVPPASVKGSRRPIEQRDRETVVEWLAAFDREAQGNDDPPDMNPAFDLRLDGPPDATGMWVWEAEGRVVSMTGYGGRSDHGMRVGPVYTPPEERGRGYASALVAGVTQWLLDERRDWVCLYTDLSNPTSNKIYQAIGYEPVLDFDEYEFVTDEREG